MDLSTKNEKNSPELRRDLITKEKKKIDSKLGVYL